MKNTYRFFVNKDCEYYPCHESVEELNCLFCYCPLYGREYCPGDPEYVEIKQNATECGTGGNPGAVLLHKMHLGYLRMACGAWHQLLSRVSTVRFRTRWGIMIL